MADVGQMALQAREAFASWRRRCVGCGACAKRCGLLEEYGGGLQALCEESDAALREVSDVASLRRAVDAHGRLYHCLRSCAGCNRCTARCPQGLSMSDIFSTWRALLRAGGFLSDADVGLVKVDCTWNCFSAFRAVQGISYDDLPLLQVDPIDAEKEGRARVDARRAVDAPRAATLFFPGCSLCSYAPQLTRAAYRWLQENVGPTLLATQCCSSPLGNYGEVERAAAWRRRVIEAARDQGVRRIVCVCPGCEVQLAPTAAQCAPEIELVSYARLLADAGVRVDATALEGLQLPVIVADSCQDRECVHGSAIRQLFEKVECVPFPYVGADALCCGAGGGAESYDLQWARNRTRRKLGLCVQAGAKTVVTACLTCSYTYAFEQWNCARAAGASWRGVSVLNYLEAVFSQRIDWPATFQALVDMWQGDASAWVAQRLDQVPPTSASFDGQEA